MQPAHGAVDRATRSILGCEGGIRLSVPLAGRPWRGVGVRFRRAFFGLDLTDTSFSVLVGIYTAMTRRWVTDLTADFGGDTGEPKRHAVERDHRSR